MKKKQMKIKSSASAGLLLLCLVMFICSCKDDVTRSGGYDPSKPVVFSDFSPSEGSIRAKFYIHGENFGLDPSKIHVSIGGQEAYTIGSSDTEIYCMVPRRAFDGVVRVAIESADGKSTVEHEFEERFNYISKTTVGTLCGKVDEYGGAGDVDGTFADAEFAAPEWLMLDTFDIEKCLYVVDPGVSMRNVNLDTELVSTVITNGQGLFRNMQLSTFDATGDTIFFSDDNGHNNTDIMGIGYLLRSDRFARSQPYVYDRCGYSCYYNSLNKSLYYNTYWKGAINKAVYDPISKGLVGKEIYPVYEGRDGHSYLIGHPEGKYLYILGEQCVFKLKYDETRKELSSPTIFVGSLGNSGYVDGVGATARFNTPYQGTFVRNEDYVRAGNDDVYDFYLCDRNNHCIRKVTPDGVVSTYAGRGSVSSDGNVWGYIDGDLKKDARFNQPCGIAYDMSTQIFYICEPENHRIRTIAVE